MLVDHGDVVIAAHSRSPDWQSCGAHDLLIAATAKATKRIVASADTKALSGFRWRSPHLGVCSVTVDPSNLGEIEAD